MTRSSQPSRECRASRAVWCRASRVVPLLMTFALFVAACGDGEDEVSVAPVRIAVGPEAESRLLAATVAVLLEDAGISTQRVAFGDVRSGRQAIELDDVDLHLAYTGEAWLDQLGRADPPADPAAGLAAVARDDASRGIAWLAPRFGEGVEEPPVNATFAFFVAGPPSIDADLRTISQLALRLSERPDLSICVDTEFGRRTDGLEALLSAYSVRRDRPFLAADPERAVLGVLEGDCIAGLSHATDGVAWRAGLQPLIDDLRFFPAFVPLPQVRSALLADRPAIGEALRPLVDGLSTGMLGRANGRVASGVPVEVVAEGLADRLIELAAG